MKYVTVWFSAMAMLIHEPVAKELGLSDNHEITSEREFWEILRKDALFGIAYCQALIQERDQTGGQSLN